MRSKGKPGKRSLVNNFVLRNKIGLNAIINDQNENENNICTFRSKSERNISFDSFEIEDRQKEQQKTFQNQLNLPNSAVLPKKKRK